MAAQVLIGEGGVAVPDDYVAAPASTLPDYSARPGRWSSESRAGFEEPKSETTQDPPPPAEQPPKSPPPAGDQPDVSDKPGSGTNMDRWASAVLQEAWRRMFGTDPSPKALQAVQAVSRLESFYGWPTPSKFPNWQGHHNWGSIQCVTRIDGRMRSCYQNGVCVKGFLGKDSFIVGGKSEPYDICFESRPTNLEGAQRFLEVLIVKRPSVAKVIDTGDAYEIALAMRRTGYFARTKHADEAQIKSDAIYYGGAIAKSAKAIASSWGTSPVVVMRDMGSGGPDPVDPGWPRGAVDLVKLSTEEPAQSNWLGMFFGIGIGVGLGFGAKYAYEAVVEASRGKTKRSAATRPR